MAGRAVCHADWLVAFGARRRSSGHPSPGAPRGIVGDGPSPSQALTAAIFASPRDQLVLLFSGLLTNIGELEAGATQADAAGIVLGLVQKRGADAFSALRGPFAVMAWDRQDADTLLVGRDQVGLEPIFYARAAAKAGCCHRRPTSLAAQPGVSSEPDAVALSEWLCGWFPAVEDTAYRAVKRVPPGQRDHLPRATTRGAALLGSVAGRRRRSSG